MTFDEAIEVIGKIIDGLGVGIVVIGSLAALLPYVVRLILGRAQLHSYRRVRQNLGRAILLGLEFLVAGDIIRTVAISPTFAGVGVLGLIVVIRTFLSMSLEVEIEGRLPWRKTGRDEDSSDVGDGRRGREKDVGKLRA